QSGRRRELERYALVRAGVDGAALDHAARGAGVTVGGVAVIAGLGGVDIAVPAPRRQAVRAAAVQAVVHLGAQVTFFARLLDPVAAAVDRRTEERAGLGDQVAADLPRDGRRRRAGEGAGRRGRRLGRQARAVGGAPAAAGAGATVALLAIPRIDDAVPATGQPRDEVLLELRLLGDELTVEGRARRVQRPRQLHLALEPGARRPRGHDGRPVLGRLQLRVHGVAGVSDRDLGPDRYGLDLAARVARDQRGSRHDVAPTRTGLRLRLLRVPGSCGNQDESNRQHDDHGTATHAHPPWRAAPLSHGS